MDSTRLVVKPNFRLDLERINSKQVKNSNINSKDGRNNKEHTQSDNDIGYIIDDDVEKSNLIKQFKLIEEENIRLREINEQLSRSLSISARSTMVENSFNSFQREQSLSRQSSLITQQSLLTSRTLSVTPNIMNNLKTTVTEIIGDRSEIALKAIILEGEFFLGLEPIPNTQSARVILSKTPSYWSIKRIPHFWEGLSDIVSSVMKKGFLNTISYWSFLRAPPSPKKNIKRWEGITIKYKGPLKEYKGYSLAGNDDGLFVYLQSEEDAYDNIFYCNFRKKKIQENLAGGSTESRSILNLLHANTRSYICTEPNVKIGENILIKLSESKRNKLMFEEVNASELLARQLFLSAEQISQEISQTNDDFCHSNTFPTFRYFDCNSRKQYIKSCTKEEITNRTVEPCSILETQNKNYGSLADELNEISVMKDKFHSGFFEDSNCSKNINIKSTHRDIKGAEFSRETEQVVDRDSRICSPRIRATNLMNKNISGLDYHEVPLNKRLNIVYIPSTTAVLVHDLVDSEEDELNNINIESVKISDAEQEYFEAE
ncbi:hypothetical protein HWI79_687 [Cryptosporidium felis]|nr:hypothetical protein HWI79_687 [Cryptosporidium felis]